MIKNKKIILIAGLILLIVIPIIGLRHYIKSPGLKQTGTSVMQMSPLRLNVYQKDKGWAYEVLIDTSVFIYQETIPGISGTKPFATKREATACGQLVIKKLENRENPSIHRHELDSLSITY